MSKIMTHLREHKNAYIFVGAGAATATIGFVLGVRASKSEAQVVQKVVQIGTRNRANPTVINLIERSTPSKPVHLVGTNLYFSSLNEAARETGHSLSKISRNINGHIPDVGGDVFQLLEPAA